MEGLGTAASRWIREGCGPNRACKKCLGIRSRDDPGASISIRFPVQQNKQNIFRIHTR